MKKTSILLLFLSLLSLISACGPLVPGYIDKGPPSNAQAYKKPGASIDDTIIALKQCGEKSYDPKESVQSATNEFIRLRMCMYDKGFKLDVPVTIRDNCLQAVKYDGFKPPVCVAKGIFD